MRKNIFLTTFLVMAMIMALGLGSWYNASAAAVDAQDPVPTIASDYGDYAPGATVNLSGANWQGDTQVRIVVNDDVGQSWSRDVTVDVAGDGTISDSFQLPSYFVARYAVLASGQQTGRSATTYFTDLSIGTYDQCSNDDGDGYASGDTGCRWINGNLQSNNSTYFEGDATVQRVWLTGFAPGSTHTLTLQYGTTKGGKHAYDFLTTWDWSENWIQEADRCQDITGCVGLAESTVDIPQDPNVPDSFEPSAPGDRQFVMRGGTLNGATTPVLESGSYAGDSETVITISFTVANSGTMCSDGLCDVALWFGAHVAAQANWGLDQGAGSIPGSPYHVALYRIDGVSIGQRDNQMQANTVTVIPNGTIVIVKDALPDDAQDFSFNLNNGGTISQNFSLDDDADPTLPNSQAFSVPPGTWTASELNIPADWSLTNLVCVDPTNNTTVNLVTGVATINLASLETVTCTYTDTKAATPTPTSTNTPTNTPTDTPTTTPTNTPTDTPTTTPTNTPTDTPTNTPTDTPTNTPTDTPTTTPTNTPTDTPTNTPTDTPTNTPTDTPTTTPTNTPTDTPTNTPTNTPTDTPTSTPTNTPTNTPTDTPTSTPTNTPTDTPTNTPTNTPTSTPSIGAYTPGYWKNHLAQAGQYLPLNLGSYTVGTTANVTNVFKAMNCSSSKPNDAIGCLAGHLLAAKLNVANGANACILPVIAQGDTFLSGGSVNNVPGIVYMGPTKTYKLSFTQRMLAISLKTKLDVYNNNISCP